MDTHICRFENVEPGSYLDVSISSPTTCDYSFGFAEQNLISPYIEGLQSYPCDLNNGDFDCNIAIAPNGSTVALYHIDINDIVNYLEEQGLSAYADDIIEIVELQAENGQFFFIPGQCAGTVDYTIPTLIDNTYTFISSDGYNQSINKTIPYSCPEDEKNSLFMAIYNPFEGQAFDVNDLGNNFEIEIIFSLSVINRILKENINGVTVSLRDIDRGNRIVKQWRGSDGDLDNYDSGGYLKLNWNIYDRRVNNVLVGNYIISISSELLSNDIEENVKSFSIIEGGVSSGCTDTNAVNYDLFAEQDDGSCKYQQDCNEKYNVSQFITDVVVLYQGYNTISYPLDFSGIDVDLFNVLNNSYYDSIGEKGAFKEGDYITAFFDDVVYTATYMGGEWIPSTNRGFSLNELSKGIGFMLYVHDGGTIIWDIA
jgi:hypothetical protein